MTLNLNYYSSSMASDYTTTYKQRKEEKKKKKEKDYGLWLKKHDKKDTKDDKEEFKVVCEVREKFQSAKTSRGNSCYWTVGTGSGGGDWIDWWDKQEKSWLMWFRPMPSDEFRSNVKSPATTGRIESTMHKLKKLNLRFAALPNDKEDVDKTEVAQIILDWIFDNGEMRGSLLRWWKDALIHGSAFARLYVMSKYKDQNYPNDDFYKLTDEQKEKAKKGEVIWDEKRKVCVFKGIVLQIIPIQEYFPDPNARCNHGVNYEAQYGIWKRVMHLDDVKSEYGYLKYSKNIDKIKGIGHYYEDKEEYGVFTPPSDIEGDEMVEILDFEDQLNDKYIVIANDRVIVDIPLPTKHKELSFHKIDCIENPHQYYGVGLADFLMSPQAAEEILINLAYDYMYKAMNLTYLIDSQSYGEFTEAHMRADSQYIPINSVDGKPLASKVHALQHQPIGFDFFRLLEVTERLQTKASNIDPSQMNLNMGGRTATSTVINKEQMEAMIGSIVDSFETSLTRLGQQAWSLAKLLYTKKDMQKMTGDDEEIKEYKNFGRIRLENSQVEINEGKVKIQEVENKYDFIDVDETIMSTKKPLDIKVKPESLEVLSKGLERQKAREMYAQLMPNAVDPNEPDKMAQHPLPLYNAVELAKYMVKTHDFPEEVLLNPILNEKREMEEAQEELRRIDNDEVVPGVPGRSEDHIEFQMKVLEAFNVRVQELNDMIDQDLQSKMMNIQDINQFDIDPMTGQLIPPEPEPDPVLLKEFDKIRARQMALVEHLVVDKQPLFTKDDVTINEAMAANQPPGPSPEEMAMMQQQQMMQQQVPAPPGMSGQMIPQGMGGPVPMPQGMNMQDIMPGMGGAQAF